MAVTLPPHRSDRQKLAAIALLLVPIALLAAFAIGETSGGDWSGLQHVVEIVPLLLLVAAAWRWPHLSGVVLLAVGVALFAIWLVFAVQNLHPISILLTAAILFAPPIAAGWLLLRTGRSAGPPRAEP